MSEENGYVSPFIGDGYDETATIPAHPGKWSAVTINYRCMSAEEESEAVATNRQTGQSMVRCLSKVMAAKISGWDLKDRAGAPVPITADNLCRLNPQFHDVLLQYVNGTLPSDGARGHLEAQLKNS